jgi:hypothetical protein
MSLGSINLTSSILPLSWSFATRHLVPHNLTGCSNHTDTRLPCSATEPAASPSAVVWTPFATQKRHDYAI